MLHCRPLDLRLSQLDDSATHAARMAHHKAKHNGRLFANTSDLNIFASKLLYRGSWCLIARDEGSGFVLHSAADRQSIHSEVSSGPVYVEVAPGSIRWDTIKIQHFHSTKALASAFFDEEFCPAATAQANRSLYLKGYSSMATLKVTCKDHKDPVEHRNLHAAARRSYSGLSMLAKS
jgi:hypothetical protein